MRTSEQKSRPATNRAAQKLDGVQTTNSLHSVDALDDIAHHVNGAFVLVLELTGGRYRRRCFLTAASAERAAARATERGESAVVYLAELKPLWRVEGGGRDGR